MSYLIERARTQCVALAALVAIFACAAPAVAQTPAIDVVGTVTADDGTPVAGASITLSRAGANIEARSDARGIFTVHASPGTYALRAAAPGYEPLSKTVTVDSSNATLSLNLARATVNSLTVIGQVSASSGKTVSTRSGPTVSVDAQKAAASGDTTVSSMLWNELSTTPVIPLGGGSNATVAYALRGPDPTETLVDIDGHQVNNGTNGDFDLSLVDPASLQDVQLIYGISPSSLLGPNTIGGAINILTLQPTATPHALVRFFGGSYGSFGQTAQATGSDGLFGYALSLHGASSQGSVNQTIEALPPSGRNDLIAQPVGSGSSGTSMLAKLRYQLGGPQGYGYVQFSVRNQTIDKDLSALLTTYTPAGFTGGGGGGGDGVTPFGSARNADVTNGGSYQSFAGTNLGAHQSNYGFDAQIPLGGERRDGAPTTVLLLSHLTSVNSQSVDGPGAQTQPYLYNQRDALGDDWAEIDHRFPSGLLSFKYDLGTENLTTDYVQGQVTAQLRHRGFAADDASGGSVAPNLVGLGQTQRSAVLRFDGEATGQLHYSLAGYLTNFSTFGSSFDPRAGLVWTPTGKTALRASVGTTFQTPSLSELVTLPPADRVPIGGVIYTGNPNLRPDRATEYDLGVDQIFGRLGRQLSVSADLYRSNLRGPSSQLNVIPVPNCQTTQNPAACPVSYPVNAGDGVYRGIEIRAAQQLGSAFRLTAGWSVNSSYLTSIPPEIQDGTFVIGQQSLGEPLHKAYVGFDRDVAKGLAYGTQLSYEGRYNALNRAPYATLDAHVAYRVNGFEFGLYGTNLTNANAGPFTIIGGGVPYGALPGQPLTPTNAYTLQGSKVVFVVTKSI
jgi:outer membrane receptor protein involved in Fe transport